MSQTATLARKPQQATHRKTRDVLEYTLANPSAAPLRIDPEKGIVYGVKVLGWKSRNGRRYRPDGVSPAAYEGASVNIDHPADRKATAERSVRDGFGVLRNVQKKKDGLYADHHYKKSHPFVPEFLDAVENFSSTLGYSHNAVVTESVKDGEVIFESVERVRSVDLVASPATTRGVFESVTAARVGGLPVHPDNAPDPDDTEEASPAADAVSKTFVAPPVVITRDGLESYVETVKRRGAPGVRVGRPVVAPMTSAELAAYGRKVNSGRPRGFPSKNLVS